MSLPAGLQQHSNLVAQWMPSSSRAGVILNPSPALAESLRHSSAWGSPSPEHNDSFNSDFAPLPASTDSSCISVNALAPVECGPELKQPPIRKETIISNKPRNGLHCPTSQDPAGHGDSFEELFNHSQDLSLMMKLEQLKQWQQHMQQQLRTRQLEELLRLQEEQQRMLGMINGGDDTGDDYTMRSGLSEMDSDGSIHPGDTSPRHGPCSTTSNSDAVPQRFLQGSSQKPDSPQSWRDSLDAEDQSQETCAWSSDREDDEEQPIGYGCDEQDVPMQPHGAAGVENHCRGEKRDKPLEDRPIKPGIGGRKQTFTELLEEQLRLEEERLKASKQHQVQNDAEAEGVRVNTKRAFLKRGEGLLRFTTKPKPKASVANRDAAKDHKPQTLAKVGTRRSSDPKTTSNANTNSSQRPQVQRKTAVLNKQNRPKGPCSPPQDVRAETVGRTVVHKTVGTHQRQNLERTERVPTDSDVKTLQQQRPGLRNEQSSMRAGPLVEVVGKSGKCNVPPNAVSKQTGIARDNAGWNEAAKEDRCSSRRESLEGSEGAVPEYSFELSFQEKLKGWMIDKQKENVELGEFELLEQAAEELSFSSNSSFVMKVLQMDEQQRWLQTAKGLHSRRLSSTPIKSPRSSPPKEVQRDAAGKTLPGSAASKTSESSSSESEVLAHMTGPLRPTGKVSNSEDEVEEEDVGGDKPRASDLSSCSSLEFEAQDVAVNPPTFPSNQLFTSKPPYDKRSYQDRDVHGMVISDLTEEEEEDEESDSVINPDESTLVEDKDDQQGGLVFDDDDTWTDIDEADGDLPVSERDSPVSMAAAGNMSPQERTLTRKVAKSFSHDRPGAVSSAHVELDPSLPLTSQLMTKLFPSLKAKGQTVPPQAPVPTAPEPKRDEEVTGQQVQSRQLRERLVQLELEIEHFKKENAALTKLRQENEKLQESLRKERLEFEQRKAEELAKFEEYQREETRKLQKERKVFEKYSSAARAIPDKKEREEIQSLKQQLSSLQEELKRREGRWSNTHSRLRQQIDSLSADNSSLKEEISTLEKLRLSAWRKGSLDADKFRQGAWKKGHLDGEKDKWSESSGASTTKGVKFASPLDTRRSSSPQSSFTVATKGPSKETSSAASGRKSSLRKSSIGPSSYAPVAPVRPTEERTSSVIRTQDKPLNQDGPPNVSQNGAGVQTETGSSEDKEQELNEEVLTHPDGKTEKVLPCGGRLIVFPNGTRKEVSADGQTAKVTFFNGDTKQVMADQRVIYYYAEAQTTHTTYSDGMEVLQFPNNQTEKHFPDGRKEITFPDQTIKTLHPDGREESVLTDGTIIQVNPNGSKEIQFNTGQKEIHTAQYKRREYPDGTVKTVYTDGRQETHYPTGRIRIKDKDGNVVMDNKV